jgi:hypothetical protein
LIRVIWLSFASRHLASRIFRLSSGGHFSRLTN